MSNIYLYLDETGTLDMRHKGNGSAYFGLGQATFLGEEGIKEWEATRLRFDLEYDGVHLPKGFHAKDDTPSTREKVYDLISRHRPRIDTTLLLKKNAYPSVRRRTETDQTHLYYLAWRLHFKYQAEYLLRPGDRVFVVAASLSEHRKKQEAAREAISRVLDDYPRLEITLCVWDSPTSWGLQVADYALWAVQRDLVAGSCAHLKAISPLIESVFRPWEGLKQRPATTARRTKQAPASLVSGRPTDVFREPLRNPKLPSPTEERAPEPTEIEWENSLPEDDPRIDDPLGVGLWGASLWSDEDPWGGDNTLSQDDPSLRRLL